MNNLSKVALDSAAAGTEPATSSRKSNALTTAPPSHTKVTTPVETTATIHTHKAARLTGERRNTKTASTYMTSWAAETVQVDGHLGQFL